MQYWYAGVCVLKGMQTDAWCNVGPKGKHRHEPCEGFGNGRARKQRQQDVTAQQSMGARPDNNSGQSTPFLPDTALACVFHHLDCASAASLASTCRACAAEYVLQKPEFADKWILELRPKVVVNPCPCQHDDMHHHADPLTIAVWWEGTAGSSSTAMRRIYASAGQPGFLNSLWKATWPQTLWQDVQLSFVPGSADWDYHWRIHGVVNILIESDKRLQVPWVWLSRQFLGTFFASLADVMKAGARANYFHSFKVSLYRPAKHGMFQRVMEKSFQCSRDNDDVISMQSFHSHDSNESLESYNWHPDVVREPLLPVQLQQVAVTGTWSHKLPNANCLLMSAHRGSSFTGTVRGDRFKTAEVPDQVLQLHYYDLARYHQIVRYYEPLWPRCFEVARYDDLASEAFENEGALELAEMQFKPYTCEVDTEPSWYYY